MSEGHISYQSYFIDPFIDNGTNSVFHAEIVAIIIEAKSIWVRGHTVLEGNEKKEKLAKPKTLE